MTIMPSNSNRIAQAGADVLRIAETSVAIKVDDIDARALRHHPAWPLCRAMKGVGIGTVSLHGAIDYFDELAEAMRGTNFTQIPGAWIDEQSAEIASSADIIVDLTNDPESKAICSGLCAREGAHLVSVVLGRTWLGLVSTEQADASSDLHAVFGGNGPSLPPVSRIAAGAALQEILAVAGAIDLAAPAGGEVVYNVASDDRSGWETPDAWLEPSVEDKVLDVIGAGAVGVHLLECLTPTLGENCELRIFDPDQVGPENLPLQIAYTPEDVGRPKAIAIAEKLAGICEAGLTVRPMVMPYEQRPRTLSAPSLRIACPDNFAARKYVNDLALQDGVPLVEAGSSPLAAQQRTYYQGRTACLEHRIGKLSEKAASGQERASCSQNRALTLPGTNMVISGILATEALRAVRPAVLGWPSRGTITYDARVPDRFGIVEVRPPCSHPETPGSRSNANADMASRTSPEALV